MSHLPDEGDNSPPRSAHFVPGKASGCQPQTGTRWVFIMGTISAGALRDSRKNKEQQHKEQQQGSSLPLCVPHIPEVIPSPRLIWAKSAEREAESSVLELTGAGGGGGPGGGGAAPAGGAGGALAPAVATGPWKSREEEKELASAPFLLR